MKKCVIIINPKSGSNKGKLDPKVFIKVLKKYEYTTEFIYTKYAGHATELMKNLDDDIDLVISAGGDGTLNEIVTGNTKRKKRLLLANLPLGTSNDVGNMYGLTKNKIKNLELILKGVKKNIDVCHINKKTFIYVACLGDYIDMTYNTPSDLKKKYGRLAYIMYGLKQTRKKINSYKIEYKIDGKKYSGEYSFIFITNATRIAGINNVYYDIKLDDGMFEVAFAHIKTKKMMLQKIIQINGAIDIKDIPEFTHYKTNNLEIKFIDKPKTSWCVDGEEYKSDSMKFKFGVDVDTKMMMPPVNINKLFEKRDLDEENKNH